MAPQQNGRNLRGWLSLIIVVLVLVIGIGTAWGLQYGAVARNTERIEKMETAQTKILDSLARIEGKLGIEPKETGP